MLADADTATRASQPLKVIIKQVNQCAVNLCANLALLRYTSNKHDSPPFRPARPPYTAPPIALLSNALPLGMGCR